MALVHGRHKNVYTAALSITANRASKVALLRSRGHGDLAERFLCDLQKDVEDFIAQHRNHPPRFAVALREAATPQP